MSRIENAMESVGYSVEYHLDTAEKRVESANFEGRSLFHMKDPFHDRALSFRRAYFYPFWRIESTVERWNFRVASMPFPMMKQDPQAAKSFAASLHQHHFDNVKPSSEGYIYMPLQGRLGEHRSFQSCSPLEMIEKTLDADPKRKIIAGLHPNEIYSPYEREALQILSDKYPRFTMSDAGSNSLLAACDYVVTQNSSVALSGYVLRKPAVLFAKIDFHHIAGNVSKVGVDAAFHYALTTEQNYERYLLWFLRKTSINARNENAETRILTAMQKSGWDI